MKTLELRVLTFVLFLVVIASIAIVSLIVSKQNEKSEQYLGGISKFLTID